MVTGTWEKRPCANSQGGGGWLGGYIGRGYIHVARGVNGRGEYIARG